MTDFQPLFIKAISLLHSTAKSSTEQLKNLLDEALSFKTNKNVTIDPIKPNEARVKEAQKRPAKPLPAVIKAKKTKSNSSSPSSRNPSPEPLSRKKSPVLVPSNSEPEPVIKKEDDSDATDIEDGSTDVGEFALEMGLTCVVCKQLDFAPGNQPVECSECHNLYHQGCHKPPITDRDVSDPRHIWYCAKCTKTMEKAVKKGGRTNTKSPLLTDSASFQSAVNNGRETAFQLIKAKAGETPSQPTTSIQPFKRAEIKVPPSPVPSGSGTNPSPGTPTKPVGLAGLAANLVRSNSSSSSSKDSTPTSPPPSSSALSSNTSHSPSLTITSSSSSSVPLSTSANMSRADKKIAQMKKKAANKKIISI